MEMKNRQNQKKHKWIRSGTIGIKKDKHTLTNVCCPLKYQNIYVSTQKSQAKNGVNTSKAEECPRANFDFASQCAVRIQKVTILYDGEVQLSKLQQSRTGNEQTEKNQTFFVQLIMRKFGKTKHHQTRFSLANKSKTCIKNISKATLELHENIL